MTVRLVLIVLVGGGLWLGVLAGQGETGNTCLPEGAEGLLSAPTLAAWQERAFTDAGGLTALLVQEKWWRERSVRVILWRGHPVVVWPVQHEPLFRLPVVVRFGGSWLALRIAPFPEEPCQWGPWRALRWAR